MVIQFPCSYCKKSIHNNHKSIFCDCCEQWIHYKCNLLTLKEYKKLEESDDDEAWYCINCIPEIFPFTRLNENEFYLTSVEGIDNYNLDNIVFATPSQKKQYSELNTFINDKINSLQDDRGIIFTTFPKHVYFNLIGSIYFIAVHTHLVKMSYMHLFIHVASYFHYAWHIRCCAT